MFRSLTTVAAAAGLMLAGQMALADNGKGHKYGRYYDGRNGNHYDDRDYGYDYARVIDAMTTGRSSTDIRRAPPRVR
jgi:hypothetical protein